ncbi:MAG: FecR family protein [Parapedobacter sp.]|nr:MAG: FecR family protein [Parapedobacter sp.]
MDSEKFKQLLHRYLSGAASDTEKETIDAWYESFRELDDSEVFHGDAEASRINSQMRERLSGYWNPIRKLGYGKHLAYAAAVLALVSIAWLVHRGQNDHGLTDSNRISAEAGIGYREITTAVRQVKKITLPDSSIVWVNASSRLRIPEWFGAAGRELYLDEGEAFFEVTPNPGKPFIVYSRGIVTQVLGTAFNISNYERLSRITVDVQQGSVRVIDTNQRLLANKLTKAQQLAYDLHTGTYITATLTTPNAANWREGTIQLTNASFEEVALAMYNVYGVELKAADRQVDDHQYSVTIRTSHRLDETLRIICSIHQNQYRRESNEVIIY